MSTHAHQSLELVFKALGDVTRLRILELLKRPGRSACDLVLRHEKGMCACNKEVRKELSSRIDSFLQKIGVFSVQ